jgi:hypothetical protein
MFPDEARRLREIAARDTALRTVDADLRETTARQLDAASTPDDFRLAAMRLMALARNGHSRAIANATVRIVPLRFVWLADGPCLVDGPHAGARLVAVNDVPLADVFGRLRPYLAGTEQRARALAGFMLAWAPAVALATGHRGSPAYCLAAPDGRSFTLAPSETCPAEDLYPVRDPGAAALLVSRATGTPLAEARQGVFLQDGMAGRPACLRIGDLAAAPPPDIAARLGAIADRLRGDRALVIDLRGNPGGSFLGAAGFSRTLPRVAPGCRVAVLVDKFTFSAAIVTAALLKVHARASLVGEEAGDSAAFHAEGGTEVLPQSGLTIRYADGWHDWAAGRADPVLTPPVIADWMVAAGSLMPDLIAAPDGADVAAGRDVALAAAHALVAA